MSKERWQNEEISNNPFAALAKLQTDKPTPAPQPEPSPSVTKDTVVQMPRVKSARIERAQRGGKTVTIVSFHGQPSDDALKHWLKSAKTKFGIGGTIENDTVVLQGDQRERLK